MNARTQIIPIDHIDEEAEFRRFERCTEARRLCEEISAEELLRARNRQKRAQREQRRKIAHNCKLMLLGAVSAACITVSIAAWQNSPVLAVFPILLAIIALYRGTSLADKK